MNKFGLVDIFREKKKKTSINLVDLKFINLQTLQFATIISSYFSGILNNSHSIALPIVNDRLTSLCSMHNHFINFLTTLKKEQIPTKNLKNKFSFAYNLLTSINKSKI
jgi:hypothetical protein